MFERPFQDISEKDYPKGGNFQEKARFLLNYAILAPSNLNSQPWKFSIHEKSVIFLPNFERWLKVSDPCRRELYISLGCALENFLIAAQNFQFICHCHFSKEQILIEMEESSLCDREENLFNYIHKRRTFRGYFDQSAVHMSFLKKLQSTLSPGIFLDFMCSQSMKKKICLLSIEADLYRFIHPDYKDELINWLPKNRFEGKLSDFATDLSLILSDREVRNEYLHNAPIFGILSSKSDDPISWIHAGQVFERVYLQSVREKIGIWPVSNILEVRQTRLKLDKFLKSQIQGFVLQTFCLGFPKKESLLDQTERKALEEVLV